MSLDLTLTPLAAQGSYLKEASELYCDRCNTILLLSEAGSMHFTSKWCDCNWDCCEHSRNNIKVGRYACHPAHLQSRPLTPVLQNTASSKP